MKPNRKFRLGFYFDNIVLDATDSEAEDAFILISPALLVDFITARERPFHVFLIGL